MHRKRFILGISVLFLAAGIVVSAQQGNGSGPKSTPPKPNAVKPATANAATPKAAATPPAGTAAAQTKVKAQTPSTTTSGNKSPNATKPATTASKTTTKSPTATAAKTDKPSTAKVAKADTKTVKSDKAADTKVAKTEKKSDKPSKTAATTTAKSGATTPTATTLSPVQQKLKQNTNLTTQLATRLPNGTDPIAAAEGFRNLGQYVAAVNVANNLNISLAELKTKMVTNNMSLGQAIQAVRPLTASATIEAQRAEYDARGMIAESEQTEASAAPKTHGPVTTPTSSTATAPTTATTVKTKSKTTKSSAQ